MATIGSLALSIRARTEQLKSDLKPALDAIKGWGDAARAAGADSKEVERAMARMRSEAMQGKDMGAGARDLEGGLRRAKVAAAALTGAISAVSSEMGGAIGHVTRLGTSLTSAFLAGGPIALGVTAVAAGIAAITSSSREAAEEAARAQAKHKEWLDDTKRRAEEVAERIHRIVDEIRATKLGDPKLADTFTQDRKNADAMLANLGEQARHQGAINKLERDRAALIAEVPDWVKKQGTMGSRAGAIAALEQEIALEKQKLGVLNEAMRKMEEEQRRAAELEALQRSATDLEERRKKLAKEGAEAGSKRVDQLREQLELAQELTDVEAERGRLEKEGMAAARERAAQIMAEREKAIEKQTKDYIEKMKKVAKSLNDGADAGKKWIDDQKQFKQGLKDELELLKAANQYERERIEIRRRLAADLAKAGDDAKAVADAQAIAAERLADVGQKEAQAAKDKAEAEKAATLEKVKQNQLAKEQLDITKRFANFGGKSPFGFGKGVIGTGMGAIGGGGEQKFKVAPTQPGQAAGGAGAAAATKPPTDVAPKVQELIETIQKWASAHERTAGSIDKLSAATLAAYDRSAKATEKAVATVARTVSALEARVRAHDQALQRAAAGAGVGEN